MSDASRPGGGPDRKRVSSGLAWEKEFGYCRAIRVGNRILVSGTTATGPEGVVAVGDPAEQTRYALTKIRRAIERLGGRIGDVVRTRVYVKPGADWESVARAHGDVFGAIRPANTLVFAELVGSEHLVEIEAEAVVSE